MTRSEVAADRSRDTEISKAISKSDVVFLTTDFKPLRGGIAEYLHGLAGSLQTQGWRTLVITFDVLGQLRPPIGPYTLIREYGPKRRLGERFGDEFWVTRKLNSLLFRLRRSRAVARVGASVRDYRGDAQVFIGVWDHVSHQWCQMFRRQGVPYGLFVYGRELVRDENRPWARRRARDIQAASCVVACSRATGVLAEQVLGLKRPASVITPAICPPDRLEDEKNRDKLRRRFGIPSECVAIGTISRLVRRKGVDLAIRAIGRLQDKGVRPFYLIAGDGPEMPHLQKLATKLGLNGHVRFLGPPEDEEKWELLSVLDLFLLPNHDCDGEDFEGFGIVLLEAAAFGLPVVAGASAGVAEAVQAGETGYLVKISRDDGVGRLASAVEKLIRSPESRQRMGRAGKRRVEQLFDWESRSEQFTALLRSM